MDLKTMMLRAVLRNAKKFPKSKKNAKGGTCEQIKPEVLSRTEMLRECSLKTKDVGLQFPKMTLEHDSVESPCYLSSPIVYVSMDKLKILTQHSCD